MDALALSIAAVAALFTAFVVGPAVWRLALAAGAVDGPGERKPHNGPVPAWGGLALAAGIAAGALALVLTSSAAIGLAEDQRWIGLAAGAIILLAVGAFDDVRPVSAWVKLAAQLAAAAVVVALGLRAEAIVNPFTGAVVDLGWAAAPLSAFWIVAVVNAFNLIDGLDGLCLGLAAVGSVALAVVAGLNGQMGALALLVIVAAASAGFLVYNWHPARIFLGDSGSLSLGFLMGAGALWATESGGAVAPAPAILALAVPLADMATAVARRLFAVVNVKRYVGPEGERFELELAGRPRLFTADRQHVHHRLLDRGYQHRRAVLILWALGCAGATAAVLVAWQPVLVLPVSAAALGLGLYLVLFQLRYPELSILRRGLLLPLFGRRLVRRRAFHALVDATLAAGAFAAAYLMMRGGVTGEAGVGSAELRAMLPAAVGVELIVFYLSGLYRGTYRQAGIGEALRVVRSVLLAAVAAAGLALPFGLGSSELGFYVINGLLLLVLVLGSRFSYSMLEYVHGRDAGEPTLLYGAGCSGELALRAMLADPSLGWRPIGFIDEMPGQRGRYRGGYPILGTLSDLPALLDGHGIRHIVVTTHKLTHDREEQLVKMGQRSGIRVTRFAIGWESLSPEEDGLRMVPDLTLQENPSAEVLPTWFIKVAPDFSGGISAVDKSDLGIEQ